MSNCLRAEKLQIIFYALENNQKPKKENKPQLSVCTCYLTQM